MGLGLWVMPLRFVKVFTRAGVERYEGLVRVVRGVEKLSEVGGDPRKA